MASRAPSLARHERHLAGALATLKTDLSAARRSGKRSDSARTPCANFADSASVALRISRIADHRRSRVVASRGANHFDGRLSLGGFTASDRYRRNLRFSLSGESPVRSILVLHFANRICKICRPDQARDAILCNQPPTLQACDGRASKKRRRRVTAQRNLQTRRGLWWNVFARESSPAGRV